MKRLKKIQTILEKNFSNFTINIIDNSNLHAGHNNFTGEGETHIIVNLKKNQELKRIKEIK